MVSTDRMVMSHMIIDLLVGKFDKDWLAHRMVWWTSVAFIRIYTISFGGSWGPVPWGPVPWAMRSGRFKLAYAVSNPDSKSKQMVPPEIALGPCFVQQASRCRKVPLAYHPRPQKETSFQKETSC